MLQLHLSDRQFYCLLRCVLNLRDFTVHLNCIACNAITNLWSAGCVLSPPRTKSAGGDAASLLWRHNGRDVVSNHQPHDCLLNRSFRRRSRKTSKLRVTGRCEGPVNSSHKELKMFPFDDVIMLTIWQRYSFNDFYLEYARKCRLLFKSRSFECHISPYVSPALWC